MDADELDIVDFDNTTLRLSYKYIPDFDLIDIYEGEITGKLHMILEKQ